MSTTTTTTQPAAGRPGKIPISSTVLMIFFWGFFLPVLQTFGKNIKLQLHHFTHLRDQTDVFTRQGGLICGSVAHTSKAVRKLPATAFDTKTYRQACVYHVMYSFTQNNEKTEAEKNCRQSRRETQIFLFACQASSSERDERSSFLLLLIRENLWGRATKIRTRKNNIEREIPEWRLFIIMSA